MKRKADDPSHLSAEVVAHLLAGQHKRAAGGLRLRLSVLQADLRGFTRIATRLDGQLVVRLLHDFFSVMTDLAVVHRATIDKPSGSAIQLLYGLADPRPDDAVRAVRTALEMQRAFLGLRNTWRRDGRRRAAGIGLRVGVATGEVMITGVAPPARSDYAAVGEPVDRAAHLCAASRDAEVLIDAPSHDVVAASLAHDVTFAAVDVDTNGGALSAYRCRLQRPRLHLVRRRAAARRR